MSREIKFRAWDSKRNEMIMPCVNMLVCSYNGNAEWQFGYDAPKFMAVELMQYTGLKDKNGKEIYEKDAVHIYGYGTYVCEFPFLELYDSVMENDIGEILGNIHENPELLDA